MIKQQQALLATEGVNLVFTDDAIHEVLPLHNKYLLSNTVEDALSGEA